VGTTELTIDDTCSFQHVQYEFNERYPFLKIDFLRPSIGDRVQLFGRKRVRGTINIEKQRTVDQITKDFEAIFGMSMMVSRRSGNLWVGTSLTTDWTLERQNGEGEIISRIGLQD
jgi:hypothetical protein